MMNEFSFEKKATVEDIEELSNLSDEALKKLDIPETARQELLMALDEAITNTVLHGYSGKGGLVKIVIRRKDDLVTLELIDGGKKFDPTRYPEPNLNVPIEERQIGGMGVPLIKKLTDGMEYHYVDAENHLILFKKTGG